MTRLQQRLLADRIDAALPQTQCRKCGYVGCRAYADAIACGTADIDQCPPGGNEGAREIAGILGVPAKEVNPRFGRSSAPAAAFIEESLCIGCTLCIQACPVDAIVGAPKLMHTVIATECTGCELCIPPCPVDCIRMLEADAAACASGRSARAEHWKARFEARAQRLQRDRAETAAPLAGRDEPVAEAQKRTIVERALLRAQQRLRARRV